jgi:hypothetical protein
LFNPDNHIVAGRATEVAVHIQLLDIVVPHKYDLHCRLASKEDVTIAEALYSFAVTAASDQSVSFLVLLSNNCLTISLLEAIITFCYQSCNQKLTL